MSQPVMPYKTDIAQFEKYRRRNINQNINNNESPNILKNR